MRGGAREREKRKEERKKREKSEGKERKGYFPSTLLFFTYSTSREVSNNSDTMKLKHKMLDAD
jgi:hypothetical protein